MLDAIRRLKLTHESMEYFGARAARPIETCLEEVRESDVLIVIVAHRYGSIVPGTLRSFAEAEYQAGYDAGKLCLVYFKADDVRVLPIDIERDPEKSASLENWKRALAEQHTVATFTTPEDLAMKVATDLARTMQAKDLAGQSAVARHPSALREEIEKLIRRATDLDVPDEYILLQIRAVLRELIDEASDIRVRIVLIYASSDSGIARISAIELERRRADVLMLEMDDDGAVPLGELTAALESAELGAVFLSNVSVSAKWMRAEVDAAVWRQISMPGSTPILPILLSDVDVPALLRTSPVVDVRNLNEMDAIAHILDAVERRRSEVRRTNPMPSWWKTMRY